MKSFTLTPLLVGAIGILLGGASSNAATFHFQGASKGPEGAISMLDSDSIRDVGGIRQAIILNIPYHSSKNDDGREMYYGEVLESVDCARHVNRIETVTLYGLMGEKIFTVNESGSGQTTWNPVGDMLLKMVCDQTYPNKGEAVDASKGAEMGAFVMVTRQFAIDNGWNR